MKVSIYVLIVFFCSCCFSCRKHHKEIKSRKLAQVDNKELFYDEVKAVMPAKMSPQDSADFVERYVNSWIRKQLLYQKAEQEAKIDETELQQRLEEYRFALLTHEFEKQYIAQRISDTVSEQEVKDFYEKNKQEFELKQNIVKAVFIKLIKTEASQVENIKKMMLSEKAED